VLPEYKLEERYCSQLPEKLNIGNKPQNNRTTVFDPRIMYRNEKVYASIFIKSEYSKKIIAAFQGQTILL